MCGVMLHINRVYIAKKQIDYFQKKKKKFSRKIKWSAVAPFFMENVSNLFKTETCKCD